MRSQLKLGSLLAAGLVLLFAGTSRAEERARMDLNGEWQFRTDPSGEGQQARWYEDNSPFDRTIMVPGVWQAQDVGEQSGILRNQYVGKAWYRKTASIPKDWAGKTVLLRVGGVVRRATVFVNGRKVGEHEGFSTPFDIDVSAAVKPGAPNVIAFLVENPGEDVTESPDKQKSTQVTGMFTYIGNWGGIYGKVHLEAANPTRVAEVAIRPDVQGNRAVFNLQLASSAAAQAGDAIVEVEAGGSRASAPVRIAPGSTAEAEVPLAIPGARLWSPDDPYLYTAAIRVTQNGRELDRITERFGMRELTTRGDVLLLNGKPLYLRGYGDDNIEVITGVQPASKEVHLERLRRSRSYGFNAVRFHSMTPVREYFEAADEAGILVMAELPVAYTMHFLPHKQQLKTELGRILRTFRNHPSFLSLAFGNEFNLGWLKTEPERKEFLETVSEFYNYAKSIDPDRIILSNDGYVMRPTDMVSLFRNAPGDVPAVRHEFGGYYCSLPDIELADRFTGVIVPTWLHRKQQWVDGHGLKDTYGLFVTNSQKLQQLGRKYQIEAARRLQQFTGYHYWLIVDFPGGTGEGDSWEEGWFNYFWEPKGVSPEQGQRLNSPVLLMIDAEVGDRTMWADSQKRIEVGLSNYGPKEIRGGEISWQMMSSGKTVGSGNLKDVNAPLGKIVSAGVITIGPFSVDSAQKLELIVELRSDSGKYTNGWNFWVFPQQLLKNAPLAVASDVKWAGLRRAYPFITERGSDSEERPGLLITSSLDAKTHEYLNSGGRVLLLADRDQFGRSGDAEFFPASGGAQGTIVLDHPALSGFPHEGFFDLQFYNLMEGAWNFSIDDWPGEFKPIAGSIRTTSSFLSKQKDLSRSAFILEGRVGKGSLLMTTFAVRNQLDEAFPESVFLFDRLLRYASGPDFKPSAEISGEQIKSLVKN